MSAPDSMGLYAEPNLLDEVTRDACISSWRNASSGYSEKGGLRLSSHLALLQINLFSISKLPLWEFDARNLKENAMKIWLAVLACVAAAVVLSSSLGRNHAYAQARIDGEREIIESFRCNFCKGTGFSNGGKGNFNCFYCKGTGRNGSY
jgi:hypothetical protein